MTESPRIDAILARLERLRADDAPTHGGRVLSYVYDPGLAELDELARRAAAAVQSLNGLDPTTFPSVARMEQRLIDFAAGLVHGDRLPSGERAVGLVTSGGTESCLLAVKSARDRWRAARAATSDATTGIPVVVAPVTAHAAFHKAAAYFDVELDLVPVDGHGAVDPQEVIGRLSERTALVVLSAPNYPFAGLDPVAAVAPVAAARGVAVHVDACIGGWVLPFWESGADAVAPWDFRVAGVTSLSMDAHKYGYAPKGASVLLFANRDAKRAAGFATTAWPGYPVVNPTMLGSRSATSLAAAWAVVEYLGTEGFAELAARTRDATLRLRDRIDGIGGLEVVGDPTGPLLAVRADPAVPEPDRVDPHLWADRVREHGFVLQPQPGLRQTGGPELEHTTHLTVTPVTHGVVDELCAALGTAADAVRGAPPIDLSELPTVIPALGEPGRLGSDAAQEILVSLGLGGGEGAAALPEQLAPVMALLDVIPGDRAESLLSELLARLNEAGTGAD
ncbi:aminotransferase class V-fold PLP-dependent enzyme [Gordonia sp. NB41Y]|uniref:pyridoxal phosphate-dependent decarboxylase family protein n=1 Tax=Gordonia sp. NB41Y TaxID=875808 RepID=UPI00273BCC9A|nr:aminotransferase class V-fold PLP-dependent enzyme [Gordonia sp. NB41Y]WLP88545.1 aminotransferase class V-fold PLP-dependent enzyme [Gordonia sp. NB41Y]